MTNSLGMPSTATNNIKNNFESKFIIKIETNSRGHNTTVHLYEGVTFYEIDDTVEKTVYAQPSKQDKIENKK
ncbi:MAG: hypothetical protein WBN72_10495 [Nitrososphaeraceae archaeon]